MFTVNMFKHVGPFGPIIVKEQVNNSTDGIMVLL